MMKYTSFAQNNRNYGDTCYKARLIVGFPWVKKLEEIKMHRKLALLAAGVTGL